MNATTRLFIAIALTTALALFILWGTLRPPGEGTSSLPINDKQIHALAFAILVLPISVAMPSLIVHVAVVALIFGGVIELVQPTFGRNGEWSDLWADAIGVGIGILPGLWLKRGHNTG